MYRQCLTLNPTSPLTTDVDQLHKFVMSGWDHDLVDGAEQERARLNILFAAARDPHDDDTGIAGNVHTVLVQGPTPPQWGHTDHHQHLTHIGDVITFQPTFTQGQTVDLSLIAHATYCPGTNSRQPDGKRRHKPLLHAPDVADWALRRLGPAATLDPHTITVTDHGAPNRRAPGPRRPPIHLHTIEATATITDPDLFSTFLTEGVGRGKSYGAGLLRARPHN